MKMFHISDVLSVTTGRLVSSRHMDGVYEILNFLIGDSLFTHQLPRAMRECEPWLRAQFPRLFPEDQLMVRLTGELDTLFRDRSDKEAAITEWVESVRAAFYLPEQLLVYELGTEMHTHIDPIEELRAMVGDNRVIAIGECDPANE